MSETQDYAAFVTAACAEVKKIAPEIVARAERFTGAEIDFMGRMNEALADAEQASETGTMDDFQRAIDDLAAMALAQAGMSRAPGATLAD